MTEYKSLEEKVMEYLEQNITDCKVLMKEFTVNGITIKNGCEALYWESQGMLEAYEGLQLYINECKGRGF